VCVLFVICSLSIVVVVACLLCFASRLVWFGLASIFVSSRLASRRHRCSPSSRWRLARWSRSSFSPRLSSSRLVSSSPRVVVSCRLVVVSVVLRLFLKSVDLGHLCRRVTSPVPFVLSIVSSPTQEQEPRENLVVVALDLVISSRLFSFEVVSRHGQQSSDTSPRLSSPKSRDRRLVASRLASSRLSWSAVIVMESRAQIISSPRCRHPRERWSSPRLLVSFELVSRHRHGEPFSFVVTQEPCSSPRLVSSRSSWWRAEQIRRPVFVTKRALIVVIELVSRHEEQEQREPREHRVAVLSRRELSPSRRRLVSSRCVLRLVSSRLVSRSPSLLVARSAPRVVSSRSSWSAVMESRALLPVCRHPRAVIVVSSSCLALSPSRRLVSFRFVSSRCVSSSQEPRSSSLASIVSPRLRLITSIASTCRHGEQSQSQSVSSSLSSSVIVSSRVRLVAPSRLVVSCLSRVASPSSDDQEQQSVVGVKERGSL
jgi:hypothetical protein